MAAKSTEQLLTVEQVLELQPGDSENATWINPGFKAVVRTIKRTQVKATGKPMNICTLGSETGAAEISLTVFNAVKFEEGDLIEVGGQGLRRTEYNGLAQVTMGKSSEIHVLGKSAHHAEQQQRAAVGAPAVDGTPQMVNGQTVGMAMKEAIALTVMAWGGINELKALKEPLFWADVKTNASNIIRLSRSLEHGKLSPAPWQGPAEPAKTTPQPATPPTNPPRRSSPTSEREAANLSDEAADQDVPF